MQTSTLSSSTMPKDTEAMDSLSREIVWYRRAVVALVAIGLLVAALVVVGTDWWHDSPEDLGTFLAGTTGIIWALAGVVLIYLAFLGQRQQILQQQEELQLTRDELALTRDEMKEQTETFESQRFDASFFSMLSAHEALVRDIKVVNLQNPAEGRRVFAQLYGEMRQTLDAQKSFSERETLEAAMRVYDSFYSRIDAHLGPYYRSLFQIISFVDERGPSSPEDVEKRRYASICRARMSSDELLVFFYNLATDKGKGFLPLAKRYNLLKHLPRERLYRSEHWNVLMNSAPAA